MEEVPVSHEVPKPKRLYFFSRPIPLPLSILILLLFLVGFGFLFFTLQQRFYFYFYPHQPITQTATIPPYIQSFYLVRVDPQNQTILPKKITFTFNEDVDEHIFSHFLYMSPSIEGKIVKGKEPNQLDFIPSTPFPKGTNISVKIASGLTSKNHNILLSDYYSSFTTPIEDKQVLFIKNNYAGKVLSFSGKEPLTFTIRKGEGLENVKVALYKSTQANLLNYLIYKKDKQDSNNYVYYTNSFVRDNIEHATENRMLTFDISKREENKTIHFPAGIYYVEAKDNEDTVVGSSFLLINSYGVTFRQDDKKVVLSTFDLKTNKRTSVEADVGFYKLENAPQLLARDIFTEFERSFSLPFSQKVDAVLGTINGETVFIPVHLPLSLADVQVTANLDEVDQIFLYTDRPIYKPKDTVYFRGMVRRDMDSLYQLPPAGTMVKVWLGYRYDTAPVLLSLPVDAHGNFSGAFALPEESNGLTYLYASTASNPSSDTREASTYFDVVTYTKPTFDLKTTVEKSEYLKHEKMKVTIKGTYLDGTPLQNEKITYAVYAQNYYEVEKAVYNKNFNIDTPGGMCGGGFNPFEEYYGNTLQGEKEITLHSNGTAEVEFEMPKDEIGSKKVTVVAKKKDTANNEIVSAANTLVHAAGFTIFFLPSAQRYTYGKDVVAPFYAESLTGEKLTQKEFTYRLVTTTYENGKSREKMVLSGKVTTDANGKGIVTFPVPEKLEDQYLSLVVDAADASGNVAQNAKSLFISRENDTSEYSFWRRNDITQTYLQIASSQNSFTVGDSISLSVKSPEEIDALVTLERGRIYQPQIVHLNKGDNKLDIPVGLELSPSITVVFSFFANGEYHTEGIALNVPAMHKLLNISLTPDKNKYNPNDTANIKITTKDAAGTAVPANIALSIVDKAIFALRKNATPPVHSSFYYFRPRRTNASSSLTWVGNLIAGGGGGGGGGGGDMLGKAIDTLYWNPNLQTDTSGELVVPVPLKGYVTTWKAQVIGSTDTTQVGQADAEFIAAP